MNIHKNKNKLEKIVIILLFITIITIGVFLNSEEGNKTQDIVGNTEISYEISNIPQYNGKVYAQINNDVPTFSDQDKNVEEDHYSDLENGRVRNGNDKN